MQPQDLKRPRNIHPYPVRKQMETEEGDGGSMYQILSLVFGMMSFILKVTIILIVD